MLNIFRKFISEQKINDLTVVVRGTGERTEKLCVELLSQKISRNNIFLIREHPFSAALKKSFEIGTEKNNTWTMVIDADILITSSIVHDLYKIAHEVGENIFTIQSEMLDKPFAGTRVGGIKFFRTSLLPKAIKFIPEAEHRPETHVIKSMHKAGFYVMFTDLICGLHDFEQYYSDIFRKGFTHAIKSDKLVPLILPYWQRQSKIDKDFEVLLAGYNLGKNHSEALKLDKDEVAEDFEIYSKSIGLTEKPEINSQLKTQDVDRMLGEFQIPPEYFLVKEENDKKGRLQIPLK